MSSPGAPLAAVILAAGQGTRMVSERPKPLHRLCGRPMLMYVVDALQESDVDRLVIVVGHKGDWVTKKVGEESIEVEVDFAEQRVRRGTGDAAHQGVARLPDDFGDDDGDVVVLPGDTPLLRAETVAGLVAHHRRTGAAMTVLTARVDDPSGYGRIVRDRDGDVERIVEQADARPEELEIDEVNTSIYCFRRSLLAPALRRLQPDNRAGEYYLTDVAEVLRSTGHPLASMEVAEALETAGVNDRLQLAAAEAELRRRTNVRWLASGVTMLDPSHTYIDTTVRIGQDVTLFPGTLLQGDTEIGDGCEIGPDTRLSDCRIGAQCVVEATTGRRAVVGDGARVGPYAVLEAGSEVPADHRSGPFYTAVADG